MRCGKPNCAGTADPPTLPGPYTQWTRTVEGKTVTKLLTEEQLARYQIWFDNARTLKDLVAKPEIVSVQAVETEAQLTGKTAPRSSTPARKPPPEPRHSPASAENPSRSTGTRSVIPARARSDSSTKRPICEPATSLHRSRTQFN